MPTLTTKQVTKQRRYQLKRKATGSCQTCGRIVFQAGECRRCYVMRSMRRIVPAENVSAATNYVLKVWGGVEGYGLNTDFYFEPDSELIKWMEKWEKRIGGNR